MMHAAHDAVLQFIRDPFSSPPFEAVALAVFAHQFECIAAYRRVCERRRVTPATVRAWRDIPPVPALAFKHVELCCAPAERIFVGQENSYFIGCRHSCCY